MPTVSVKLAEETKARVDRLAASRGVTPHAVMVQAIEDQLTAQEGYDVFVQQAVDAYDGMVASGKAYDGDDVIAYLRAKSGGAAAAKPRLKSLKSLLKPSA